MEVWKEFRFEAAHSLPHLPDGHKCKRLHGHSYKVKVVVSGEVNKATGMVVDYAEIGEAMRPLIEAMDHHDINKLPGLGFSTSENLARWIFWNLVGLLPTERVEVYETPTCGSSYSKMDYRRDAAGGAQ